MNNKNNASKRATAPASKPSQQPQQAVARHQPPLLPQQPVRLEPSGGRATSQIAGWAILPLRAFLGISFIIAGLDKLTDPTYLDPASRSYIGNQIAGFAPGTPLESFLLNVAVPNANLFGVMVMGGELLIGLAVLLGLLTRFSAVMGFFINIVFFLSATWEVHPFYFGADLPYAVGWITLALTGAGPFALDPLFASYITPNPLPGSRAPQMSDSELVTRRAVVGAGLAGMAAAALAATGVGWGILNSGRSQHDAAAGNVAGNVSSAPSATATSGTAAQVPPPQTVQDAPPTASTSTNVAPTQAPPEPSATPQLSQAPAPAGVVVASAGQVPTGQSLAFTLPTGDPAVLVHNGAGYSAYVAICTHEGCLVQSAGSGQLVCPCHGARFDANNGGIVLRGPARRPLSPVALNVTADGTVYLAQ